MRSLLNGEFEARRARNPRYSLRSFARDLDLDHSTLSQILRCERRVPVTKIRGIGQKLGLNAEEITALLAAAQAPDPEEAHRQEQLRHWSAEAMAVFSEPHHHGILRAVHSPEFRPDSRWLAERLGVSADDVNIAVARLARLGLLQMSDRVRWHDVQGLGLEPPGSFRKKALERIRQLAPMFPKNATRRKPRWDYQ